MKKLFTFFAILMMATTAAIARDDIHFSTIDTWTQNETSKSLYCTKDGVTITIKGSQTTPSKNFGYFEFGEDQEITITVEAGGETVKEVEVVMTYEVDNFLLSGTGPWTCNMMGSTECKYGSRPFVVGDIERFIVRVEDGISVELNDAGYATFSCNTNTSIGTAGVKAYKASVSEEAITLTELTGYIPAGTGVILYGDTPASKVNFSIATSGSAADVTGNALKATTKSNGSLATLEANSWALGNGNQFLSFKGTTYKHNRAYLVHEKAVGAKAINMVFADEATGIDSVTGMTSVRSGKIMENGKVVIIKNGMKYNVAGQVIK